MPNDDNARLRSQVEELTKENESLRKQLADTRAQRAEYLNYICELIPPIELPTEAEMAEQMKNLIPAEQVLREIDQRLKNGNK